MPQRPEEYSAVADDPGASNGEFIIGVGAWDGDPDDDDVFDADSEGADAGGSFDVARRRRKPRVSRTRKALQTDGHDVPADAWKRFTPDVVDFERCIARTFVGGYGGQCSQRPVPCSELCANHAREAERVVGLAHGLVTGEIPRAKLLEFVRRSARREERELKVAAGEEVARRGGKPKASLAG